MVFILHSDQFKPKSYLKLIKKYIFSEGEQFPLMLLGTINPYTYPPLPPDAHCCNSYMRHGALEQPLIEAYTLQSRGHHTQLLTGAELGV